MIVVSKKFILALRTFPERNHQVAQKAGLHYSTLSRLKNGIERTYLGDRRILKAGRVLGLDPGDCFEESNE